MREEASSPIVFVSLAVNLLIIAALLYAAWPAIG